jgi:putative ABC transport system permease protein
MFKNYLKTAWRNITRETSTALINLSGLTLGITCCLVLFLMVMHFLSFDKFQTKRDRIYRVVNQSEGNNGTVYQAGVPPVLPEAFKTDFPEAEEVVFTSYRANSLVTIPQRNGESKKFQEEKGVVFTQPEFFKIFDRKVIQGNALSGIDEPNEAIISTSFAKKYFNKEDVIGEVVKYESNEFKITAIIDDAPNNTDFPFDLLLSYATIKKQKDQDGWHSIWSDEQCYFLLKKNESISKIESRLPAFSKKYLGEDDFDKTMFHTQPLTDLHYDDRYDVYSQSKAPKAMIIAFGVIAIILIVTACINFINLATAEAIKRSKEVGVRKSLGSSRRQLIGQFLGETTFITVIAVLVSLGCAQIALSFLNPFLDMNLSLNFVGNSSLWFFIIGITLTVSILSGLYPAFIISSFSPALVLKNQIGNKNSSSFTLRRILVVAQFFISQLLIIITIVIIYQMKYSQQKDLGFSKEAIVFVPIPERESPIAGQTGTSKMRTIREEMVQLPGVEMASLASAPPASGNVSGTNFKIAGVAEEFNTQLKQIDGNYLSMYNLKLVAGRNISDLDTATGFLVNEKLTKVAGFKNPEEALGKELTLWGKTYPVVGIVKDFHTVSLHRPIEATVMFNRISGYRTLGLKIDMRRSQDIIDQLKQKWEAAYPEHLFEYEFLDQSILRFYEGEKKISTLLGVFTGIAIFIGCLGLFGLASFMANQKTKEIGVRKVMGASVESIVFMFSKEYVMLIVIGFALSAPLAWFAMNAFLDEFAYKINLGPEIFMIGFFATLVIAMLTVGYKSIKAAVVNPVKSLRYE